MMAQDDPPEFAAIAAAAYGDRVARWCTINEPATVTTNGYTLGLHSPGEALKCPRECPEQDISGDHFDL